MVRSTFWFGLGSVITGEFFFSFSFFSLVFRSSLCSSKEGFFWKKILRMSMRRVRLWKTCFLSVGLFLK